MANTCFVPLHYYFVTVHNVITPPQSTKALCTQPAASRFRIVWLSSRRPAICSIGTGGIGEHNHRGHSRHRGDQRHGHTDLFRYRDEAQDKIKQYRKDQHFADNQFRIIPLFYIFAYIHTGKHTAKIDHRERCRRCPNILESSLQDTRKL